MVENTKIISIEVRTDEAIRQIAQLDAQIEGLKKQEAALKKEMKEGDGATSAQREAMAKLKNEITYLNGVKRAYTSEVQNATKANNANEGSLKQLRAQLSSLTAQYDVLSRTEREGEIGKNLQKQIKAINDELKSGEEATGRFQRSVGSYAQSLAPQFGGLQASLAVLGQGLTALRDLGSSTVSSFQRLIAEFKTANTEAVGLGTAQRAAAVGTNVLTTGFKFLKVAIAATGIGLLIVALGTLYSFFTRTQEGVEKFNVILAQVGAVVDVILDRVAMLGKAIFQVFSGDFAGAANTAKGALVGIGEELTEETRRAGDLRKALNEIEKQETSLQARRAAEKVQIADLRRVANDTTKSYAERTKAQEEANRIALKTAEDEKKLGELRIANMLGYTEVTKETRKALDMLAQGADADSIIQSLGLAQGTIKDYKELVNVYGQYNQKVQEFTQMTVEGTAKVNAIAKEAAAKAKEARDKELAEAEKVIDLQISLIRDEIVRKQAEEETAHRRKVEELKRRLAEEDNLTLAARQSLNQQIELEEQRHEQAMATLDKEAFDKNLKETQERHQQFLEEKKTEFNEELDALIAELVAEQEVEFEADKADLARIIGRNEKEAAIEKEKAEQEAAIEKLKQELYADSKKALQVLAEENEAFAVASKALALGEIAVNTGKAIAAGVANASAVPFPANIAAIATTVLTVMANIATAIKTVKGAKFATGGFVSGEGSATSDSIPAMLSNTESVNNAQATAMFWPMQSAFNVMGGGVPITPPSGSVNTAAMRAGEDMLARSVSKGVQSIRVVASWTEGQAVGDRVKMLESLGDVA